MMSLNPSPRSRNMGNNERITVGSPVTVAPHGLPGHVRDVAGDTARVFVNVDGGTSEWVEPVARLRRVQGPAMAPAMVRSLARVFGAR